MDKDGKTSIRLSEDDRTIIARISKRFGDIPASAVIRMALRAYDKQLFRGKKE